MRRREILTSAELERLLDALDKVRERVQWRTGKDVVHLDKRRRMGHLAPDASLADYDQIICEVLRDGQNIVYLYEVRGDHYYAVRAVTLEPVWLVIFGANGLMETAFPPAEVEDYLQRRGFILLGRMEEVLKWKELDN